MKFKVIGYAQKQGEYNGHAYDNTYLHVVSKKNNVTGQAAEAIKLKTPFVNSVLLENDFLTLNDLIGRTVEIGFDQYGIPEELEVLESAPPKPATK